MQRRSAGRRLDVCGSGDRRFEASFAGTCGTASFVGAAYGSIPAASERRPAASTIEKAVGGGPLVGVSMTQDCDGLLPVVFGPADGVAYESLKPRTLLIASN